ncbi:MAG: hypothetical protein ACR2GN_00770 [Bacteroidia bacterium]
MKKIFLVFIFTIVYLAASLAQTELIATGCSPSTAKTDLDINNVRAKLLISGDMWWDLSDNLYEIPKGSGLNSIFCGAIWIGGVDAGGQLKIAAMTYRQDGNDFWPGPINKQTVDVDPVTCSKYDRHWKLNKDEVEDFIENRNNSNYIIPEAILNWPGNGDDSKNEAQFLAPFFDVNNDGIYDPLEGDYPYFDFENKLNCKPCGNPDYADYLMGDQNLWWVFNDVGNIHLETEGNAIGIEIQAQAFAYMGEEPINNTTFYKYKLINRSNETLYDTWFGQWVDIDLGNYGDDYVGCDVSRGMGFGYNGDEDDDGFSGYGLNPPSIGADFVQGILADPFDGIDNNRDSVIDEPCEDIIMSMFKHYQGDFTITGNPENAYDFYDFMQGKWKDGSMQTYGGNGALGAVPAAFFFPGDSDPQGWGTGGIPMPPWTEASAGNLPGDRRFLMSAGAFTMQPGAVNYVTTAVIWSRANSGGRLASVQKLKNDNDNIQALFDNCFRVIDGALIDGPSAPDLEITEMDGELNIEIKNYFNVENFEVEDPGIPKIFNNRTYKFQGYQIFQVKDPFVTVDEILTQNPEKVRLAAQTDIQDSVIKLVNFRYDRKLNASVPQLMVNGENFGLNHEFIIKQDHFSETPFLINHKKYYYTIIAYAHNEYKPYILNNPDYKDGQKVPYLPGRENVKVYSAIPHKSDIFNLNSVKLVPNPFYAGKDKEKVSTEIIRITNLPTICTIKIFNLNGKLVKTINRNLSVQNTAAGALAPEVNLDSSEEWELKNEYGNPVGSGIYLFHVSSPSMGEIVLKGFITTSSE